jgi:hypothetical protein
MSDLPRFPDSLLDEIRGALPITEVIAPYVTWDEHKSVPAKRDMWACCPFHGEKSPSFHADDAKGIYHCFGCGVTGDHFKFLMQHQGKDFPEAVRIVAALAKVSIPGDGGREPAPQPSQDGRSPAPAPEEPPAPETQPVLSKSEARKLCEKVKVKGYSYTDRDGNPLYQVVRFQFRKPDGTWLVDPDTGNLDKTFMQRRKGPNGDSIWNLEGIEHTIYHHPAVEIALADGSPIFITEGEKDVETLQTMGFVATTNSGGAGFWTTKHAALFKGADVIIMPDNDPVGIAGGQKRAASLRGIAKRIRVLNFGDHIPDFGKKGDVTEWVEKFGGTASELVEIINTLPDWKPAPPATTFGAQTSSIIAHKAVVYDWLVKGLIERNGTLILAGESMVGKSFKVMDMGMKIALGLPYGDRKTRKGAVIHMAVEDGKGTELRYKGYLKHHGISPDADIPYVVMDPFANGGAGFSLMSDDVVDKFIAECLEWKAFYGSLEFIIIDTLSMATEGLDENSSGEAGKVLGRVTRIRERTGATVCLVHHMNSGGTKVRGSTAIVANVPNVIEIKMLMTIPQNRREDPRPILDGQGRPIRRARLAKNKNGVANKGWSFVLEEVLLDELDDDGEPYSTMVCSRKAVHRQNHDEDTTKLVGNQKLVFDALVTVQTDSGIDMPAGAAAPPQISKCVAKGDFVAAVRRVINFTAADGEIEAQNRELSAFLKTTTTALINAGYMGRDNDKGVVWWTGKSDRPKPRAQPVEPEPAPALPAEVRDMINSGEVPF